MGGLGRPTIVASELVRNIRGNRINAAYQDCDLIKSVKSRREFLQSSFASLSGAMLGLPKPIPHSAEGPFTNETCLR